MVDNNSLLYDSYDIVFSEIPNEVCLAFTIVGCQNNCKGCHSPHLREMNGKNLNNDINKTLSNYNNLITTILFLGEGHDKSILIDTIKTISKKEYKIALYSGRDCVDNDLVNILDYYKVGSYNEEFGGLRNPSTNQKLFKIKEGTLADITYLLHDK